MADNSLAGLKASLRGELITRDDKEAFTAARFARVEPRPERACESTGLRRRLGCAGHRDDS